MVEMGKECCEGRVMREIKEVLDCDGKKDYKVKMKMKMKMGISRLWLKKTPTNINNTNNIKI